MTLEEKYLSRKIITYSKFGEVGKYLIICPKDVPALVDWFFSGPRRYRGTVHAEWNRRLLGGELVSEFGHPRGTGLIKLIVHGTDAWRKVIGDE